MDNRAQKVLELAARSGLLRPRDLNEYGIARTTLSRLVAQGRLERIDRGLYALPERDYSAHVTLAEVTRRCPKGIVCLLSALTVHELTTQLPFQVWLAIPHHGHAPRLDYPSLRIIRFTGAALYAGVETHLIDSVEVRVTGVERTVVDCFRFRNKIGLDVALEALHESYSARAISMDVLCKLATELRIYNVMRPYLESVCR